MSLFVQISSTGVLAFKLTLIALILLVLLPVMALYALLEVWHKYKRAVNLVINEPSRAATLVWLNNWGRISLSFDEEESHLVRDSRKRILYSLRNFEKLVWLFIRVQLGLGDDKVRPQTIKNYKPVAVFGPALKDKQKLAVLFLGSTPMIVFEEGEVFPESPKI